MFVKEKMINTGNSGRDSGAHQGRAGCSTCALRSKAQSHPIATAGGGSTSGVAHGGWLGLGRCPQTSLCKAKTLSARSSPRPAQTAGTRLRCADGGPVTGSAFPGLHAGLSALRPPGTGSRTPSREGGPERIHPQTFPGIRSRAASATQDARRDGCCAQKRTTSCGRARSRSRGSRGSRDRQSPSEDRGPGGPGGRTRPHTRGGALRPRQPGPGSSWSSNRSRVPSGSADTRGGSREGAPRPPLPRPLGRPTAPGRRAPPGEAGDDPR